MSRIEITNIDEINPAARRFADAATAPADAAAQVARRLVLGGGPERSGLDDSMSGTLDRIRAALDAAARARAGRADAIEVAAADVVDGLVAADESGAAQIRGATPS